MISWCSPHLQPEAEESDVNSKQEGKNSPAATWSARLYFTLYVCAATDERSATSERFFFPCKKCLLSSNLSFTHGTCSDCVKVGLEGRASKKLTLAFQPGRMQAKTPPQRARDGIRITIFSPFLSNPPPSHLSLMLLIRLEEAFEVASPVMRFWLSASPQDTVSFADYPPPLSTHTFSALLRLYAILRGGGTLKHFGQRLFSQQEGQATDRRGRDDTWCLGGGNRTSGCSPKKCSQTKK